MLAADTSSEAASPGGQPRARSGHAGWSADHTGRDVLASPAKIALWTFALGALAAVTIGVFLYRARVDASSDVTALLALLAGLSAATIAVLLARMGALAASAAAFRETIESAPDALFLVNPDGRIALVNAEAERLFGYQRSELIGQPVEILVPHDARQRHRASRANFARSASRRAHGFRPGAVRTAQGWYDSADRRKPEPSSSARPGDACWQRSATSLPVGTSSGNWPSTPPSCSAPTPSSRSSPTSPRTTCRSRCAWWRATSSSSSRRYRDRLDDDAREFIGFAVDGATRMKQLINDLLGYSRAGNAPLKARRRRHWSARRLRRRNPVAADRGSARPGRSRPVADVRADPIQLARVFQNLIDNALKYRSRDAAARPRSSPSAIDGYWKFSVARQRHRHRPAVQGQDLRDLQAPARPGEILRHRHRPCRSASWSSSATAARSGSSHVQQGGSVFSFTIPAVRGQTRMASARPIEILLVEDNPAEVRLTIEGLKEAKIANHLNCGDRRRRGARLPPPPRRHESARRGPI